MKLNHKIIFLPVMVMVVIFVLGLFAVEYQVKQILKQKFEQELQTLSSFALSSITTSNHQFNGKEIDPDFDLLANHIAKASNARISYFFYNGVLLGDSKLTFAQIITTENHANKPEIIAAIANNSGISHRFSQTLQQQMVYFARFDRNSGFIARIALPENAYSQTIANIRWGFTLIILATVLAIIVFALFAIKFINKTTVSERKVFEKEIVNRTKELTLLQTMTTMINNAPSINEAGGVLANILPKLLANYSGALYIIQPPQKELSKITCWGENWPKGARVFNESNPQHDDFKLTCAPIACIEANCNDCNIFLEHCYGVNLISNNALFGKIYFVNLHEVVNDNTFHVIQQLVAPINSALANVQLKTKLHDLATHDPLTGLYNRRYMLEAIDKSLHRADRQKSHVAVLMIDLDHFKNFNDKFGHQAGDIVLAQVAEQFRESIRLEDIACRYGGEEFCIICPDTLLNDAYSLAEKLRTKISKLSLQCQGKQLDIITMSIGVAIYPSHAPNGHDLIIAADKALYQAKSNGRNCSVASQTETKIRSLS
ncbi:MAG: hypothetical protein COB35_11185 [Gammaproteobacteria bacterium]|nr:MAG: hypothetical protein COB35_11185 [Gammaproteobacteria bacterium]